MKTKIVFFFIIYLFSHNAYSCLEREPATDPILISFGPIIFDPLAENINQAGSVKALLSIDREGRVKHFKILEITPSNLDATKISKAIKKSKFRVRRPAKDFIYTFDLGS